MARANVSSGPLGDLYLLPGEIPETRDLEDARQWIAANVFLEFFDDTVLDQSANDGLAYLGSFR